jgi:hypothetical protein
VRSDCLECQYYGYVPDPLHFRTIARMCSGILTSESIIVYPESMTLVNWLVNVLLRISNSPAVCNLRDADRHFTQSWSDYKWEQLVIVLSGVRLSPLGTATTTGLLYHPQMIDDGDCGAIGGMKMGRGNRSTRRNPASVPLCHHKSHMTRIGLESGPPRWEASD